MTTQQGLRQASFRAIGSTAGAYEGDAMAAMAAELTAAELDVPTTFNGLVIAWLQYRLNSSRSNVNDLLAAWAEAEGADKVSAIGSFDATVAIVQDGLVASWAFDEGEGTTAADSSGNGFDITGMSGGWITGGFDGTVAAGPGSDLGIDGTDPRTVIAVVLPDDLGSGNTRFGLEWTNGASPTNGTRWTLRCATSTDDYRFENQGAGETESALNFDFDAWAFIAAVQAAGGNMDDITLYKDGETPIALSTSSAIDTAGNFQLWGVNNGNAGCGFGYVLVYNRALEAAEIAQNRAALTILMADRGVTLP